MPLPPSFAHVGDHEPDYLRQLRNDFARAAANNTGPQPFCVSEEDVRQITALTYGMVAMIDDAVAALLEHLETLGIRDNTVVIFTSDHGDFMGDHGLMLKHGLHYDGVLRVPFIWADSNRPQRARTDLHGSSVDISACVLSRAGITQANGNQGIDVVTAAQDGIPVIRAGVLIEEDELGAHLGREDGLRTRSYIEDNWRVTIWDSSTNGELFNRNDDPHEMHNLWHDIDSAPKRAAMTEAMLRETIRLNDTAPYATYLA